MPFVVVSRALVASASVVLFVGACGPAATQKSVSAPEPPSRTAAPARAGRTPAKEAAPGEGKAKLTVAEARKLTLELINKDRATEGLPPPVLDDGAAEKAGQRHAEDMAARGFLGHFGSDGSVPEQRYTEAGGTDFVMENASCVTDEKTRELDPAPLVDREALVRAESMFFNETPPNDGHRKNILKREHKRVGIGIAQAKATATELPGLCLTHEFVDPYGTYAPLPKRAKAGGVVRVEGEVHAPAKLGGVGIARLDAPKPIPVHELNQRRSYAIPEPYRVYWPAGFKTEIPVAVSGNHFSIDVPLARGPDLYAISILGQYPGQKAYGMIGLRTVVVE